MKAAKSEMQASPGEGPKKARLSKPSAKKGKAEVKNELTHITILLDRTGSMESIRDDTIGGFNAFLNEQKSEQGTATLTLVQFDSQDPYEVIHSFKPVREVPELTRESYVPRASTPLLDAIGRGINDLESHMATLNREARPSKVIMAVVTDGQENSSREFKKSQITQMIKEKTEKDDWQFVFLSADLAAIEEAGSVGFAGQAVFFFEKSGRGSSSAWGALSKETSNMRTNKKEKFSFEDEDRKHPEDKEKKND